MKIAVVGSINMDMTVTAEKTPLEGETLKGEDIRYIPGGEGTNQAVTMAELEADVEMFDCVGDDEAGRNLIKNMEDMGVGTIHIKVAPGVSTGLAVITIGDHDDTIVVAAGVNDRVDREYMDSIKDALLACGIVLLQHEIPQDTIEYVIDICHENGVRVVLNPGPVRPVKPEVLAEVDYLTPNEHEAAILLGDMPVEGMFKAYPGKLVITQGFKGVSTYLPTGETFTVSARKVNVVDTTGTGGTLNGAFTVQIAGGSTMEEALRFVNMVANLSTERFGTQGGMSVHSQVLEAMHQEKMQRIDRYAFGVKKTEGQNMKRHGILSNNIPRILSAMGHTNRIAIADCGLPVPEGTERVDLAATFGNLRFMDVLKAVSNDMKIEAVVLAGEIKEQNPQILEEIQELFASSETGFKPEKVESASHTRFKEMTKECRAIIRAGETKPYANIILQSGCIF